MWGKILQSRWFTSLALVIVLALGFAAYRLLAGYRAVGLEARNLENKISEVKQSTTELEKQNSQANNPAWLERQARIKLNYKKPDEQVVFVYRNQYDSKTGSADNPVMMGSSQTTKWWQVAWQWLKDKIN